MPDKNGENRYIDPLTLRDFIRTSLSKWVWFVGSLVICLGLAVLYIKCQEPVFQRSEQILIKSQDSNSGISSISNSFTSLGLFSNNSNVMNELISITSPAVMADVVNKLDLRMNYVSKNGLRDLTLYGETLPFIAVLPEIGVQESGSFRCELSPDGNIRLWDFKKFSGEDELKDNSEISAAIGKTVATPIGKVSLIKNPSYKGGALLKPLKIEISKEGMQSTIEDYCDKLTGDLADEFAEIINLSFKDVNVERAVDVLTEIVNVYNNLYLDDRNKVSKATSAFIEERLRVIEQELGSVDSNIANYRSATGAYSFYEQGKQMLEKSGEYEDAVVKLGTDLELAKSLQAYFNDSSNKNSVLPAGTGLENEEVELQISKYNELLLMRNALVSNSSENNPVVKEYDIQLEGFRKALRQGLANQIKMLQTNLKAAKDEQAKAFGKLKSTPTQTLPLLSEERQQKVKENLYLFLLEKREENELGQKFTADNTRVITPPTGSLKPVAPKKMIIMGGAFILGLFIPFAIVYLKLVGDTKVRSKKDLEKVQIPFAGEIPQVGKAKLKTNANSKKKINLKDEKAPISVVEDGKRDIVNEAFRVIRSNIEFMSKGKTEAQVIMLTSFNPGSGKSFISYNLALTFALKKKRVLVIDCDLRHGSSSMYVGLPSKGLSNYLIGQTQDWQNLVMKSPGHSNLDILPIGKMPPNPAELLEEGRLGTLIEEAKRDYDYIFLDCPPVNIVVDTQIVGRYADSTLFVVRAGLLDKNALSELDSFYNEHKFKHMSLILNGTDSEHSRYYTYGNYHNYIDS